MGCCGVSSPSDWVTYNSGFQRGDNYDQEARDLVLIGINVPESCCAQALDKVTRAYTSKSRSRSSSEWSQWSQSCIACHCCFTFGTIR